MVIRRASSYRRGLQKGMLRLCSLDLVGWAQFNCNLSRKLGKINSPTSDLWKKGGSDPSLLHYSAFCNWRTSSTLWRLWWGWACSLHSLPWLCLLSLEPPTMDSPMNYLIWDRSSQLLIALKFFVLLLPSSLGRASFTVGLPVCSPPPTWCRACTRMDLFLWGKQYATPKLHL